ncbi:hypothetical protein [Methylobacterium sp. WL6]|uniref:hypothetical protein n=1 Tax=Methylobacterium sp. WL6 TaxID=2603901 RepID=UPI0011CB0C38|nr:hypothetical protein [Methylobacterium sp. WL6]TXN71894.1 hypothetical protein FV230_06845 [Methylobacterium sp. WL6]
MDDEKNRGAVLDAILAALLTGTIQPVSRKTKGVALAQLVFLRADVEAVVGDVSDRPIRYSLYQPY